MSRFMVYGLWFMVAEISLVVAFIPKTINQKPSTTAPEAQG